MKKMKRIEVLAGGSCRTSSEGCETAKPVKKNLRFTLHPQPSGEHGANESKQRVTMASTETCA